MPSKRFGVLTILVILLVFAGCQTVPLTGRSQLMLISEEQEIQMGQAAWKDFLKKAKISTDPRADELVHRVGERIAAATGKRNYQWEFKVVAEDKTINAFCIPGGKVAVYTGILPVAKDDTGLATVLGHEIAHAIARHGGERVSEGVLAQLGAVGLSAALGRGDPQTVQSVNQAFGLGVNVGFILPFGRTQESEADHLGLIFMAKAGYDPRAAISFWQRMEAASKDKSRPPEFLSTHPNSQTRMEQIRAWLPEALKYYQGN